MLRELARASTFFFFANMKDSVKDKFFFVCCPSYVLNNNLQHGMDCLDLDIQSVVCKTCDYLLQP